ncbi:MAG: hypothetical protein ACRCZB_03890 [Bacteroidales bacterium]
MIKTFVITLLIYFFIVLPFLFRHELWSYFFLSKKSIPKVVSHPNQADIIIKSKTQIGQVYIPNDKATPNKKVSSNEITLALENERSLPATIPKEELDEAFSDVEKLDIDVAMEVDDEMLDEDVEAEELVSLTGGLASGVSIDQMSLVVTTLSNATPTTKEQEEAAKVLEKVHDTEMMLQIIDSIPEGDLRVKQMLMACEQRIEESLPNARIVKGGDIPDDFKLEEYLN